MALMKAASASDVLRWNVQTALAAVAPEPNLRPMFVSP